MKLYQKLLLGFATVALLVGCVGYVAQQMNQRVQRSVVQLTDTAVQELYASADMGTALRESLAAKRRAAAMSAGSERDAAVADIEGHYARFESALAAARNATSTGRRRAVEWNREDVASAQERKTAWLETLTHTFVDYRTAGQYILENESGGMNSILVVDAALEPIVFSAMLPVLSQYREAARSDVAREAESVRTQILRADRFLFVSVLLAIGIALVLVVLIANSIAAPLFKLREATRDFGRGRFDLRVRLDSRDEVADLGAELNRMAAELSETTVSKQYLDLVLASMSDPLFVLESDGQIRQVNKAAASAVGRRPYELVGRSMADFLVDGTVATFEVLNRVEHGGSTGNIELQLLRRDGKDVPVVFSAARMLGPDGEDKGIVAVAKDITAQKLVQTELVRARREAEEMARMKSSFLANMSHEIRTPLTGIIGSSQVLAEIAGGDALEVAHIIERAGVRLLASINSVLDLARIEAGELSPYDEVLNLAEEAHDAACVLRRLAQDKGVDLQVIERVPDVRVHADPGFLNRIVTNLVGNAIKFTEHGHVHVIVDVRDDDVATLEVVDTGIGMSQDFIPQLFAEFKQESAGLSRTHEGSGLGLAITKKLVDLMDASIEVRSEKGAGTSFTVTLPLAAEPSAPRGAQAVEAGGEQA